MQLSKPLRTIRLPCTQAGFLLIEVVVSLLISAIGLLALMGVHAVALRHGKLSQHRALATQLAQDMAERLRANKAQAVQGAYDFNQSFGAQAGNFPAAPGMCDGPARSCTPLQLAQADMNQWRQRVRSGLPEGSVQVLRSGDQRGAGVWVAWREPVPAPDELLSPAQECPASLLPGAGPGLRCSHLRVGL